MKNYIKKILIKLSTRYSQPEISDIYKIQNGYVFGGKYYRDVDEMSEDLINSIKYSFK